MYLCHVRIVNATMMSSVRINAEKLIDTMWINSSSNRTNAPYIITPPRGKEENNTKTFQWKCFQCVEYVQEYHYILVIDSFEGNMPEHSVRVDCQQLNSKLRHNDHLLNWQFIISKSIGAFEKSKVVDRDFFFFLSLISCAQCAAKKMSEKTCIFFASTNRNILDC